MATLLLLSGFVMIKKGNITAHKRCMVGAFVMSMVFLVCYVVHYIWRASTLGGVHTPYNGQGFIRLLYYLMLFSHIILAMTVPVFAVWLIRLGVKGRFERHRRVARFGFPIWVYVSVTGVLIYVMLYHWNPSVL